MTFFLRAPLVSLCLALVACGGSDSGTEAETTFSFGDKDMAKVATGDFTGTMSMTGKPDTTFTLHLDQSKPASNPACGSRTFVHPLCVDLTTMGVGGILTSADGTFDKAAVTGSLEVIGTEMKQGTMHLTVSGKSLSCTWDGAAFQTGQVMDASSGAALGTFTLKR